MPWSARLFLVLGVILFGSLVLTEPQAAMQTIGRLPTRTTKPPRPLHVPLPALPANTERDDDEARRNGQPADRPANGRQATEWNDPAAIVAEHGCVRCGHVLEGERICPNCGFPVCPGCSDM